MTEEALRECIELLCGQKTSPSDYIKAYLKDVPDGGLGHSQLNEILLACQLDRIGDGLFKFIFKNEPISDLDVFKRKIIEFRKVSAIHFGNFKYAYKQYCDRPADEIEQAFNNSRMEEETVLRARHLPIANLIRIEPKDTPLLGYITEGEPNQAEDVTNKVKHSGKNNNDIYLDYDHMDVYIATSMREKLDYWNVARFAQALQKHSIIHELRLRFFDPTQAYCPDRIEKSLVEGLMLRRAKCTIYLAGESETLGKDSELATTLAQGKTVIAFVPKLDDFEKFENEYLKKVFSEVYPDDPQRIKTVLKFLQIYWPEGAWKDKDVCNWIRNQNGDQAESFLNDAIRVLYDHARDYYNKRAEKLKVSHPLGLQVNLDTGVANGVLVARTIQQCAILLKNIMLNQLELHLEERENYYALIEQETGSIYRVVTKNEHLANSFWNFYSERARNSAD